METSTKQIDSFIKMFALLKLLLEGDANFNQVISAISDETMLLSTDNSIHSVTLNKYINTLKFLNINIIKEKGTFHLINPPYKLDLNEEELTAFNLIKEYAEKFNDETKIQKEFTDLIKSLESRFSEHTQLLTKKINSENKADFNFYYTKTSDKLEICSKFCKEDYKVEIIYYTGTKKVEKKIIGHAQEIIYRKNSIKIQVLNLTTYTTISIPLTNIISIKQLPVKIPPKLKLNHITVFGLRGRLAKNYRPRKWEYTQGVENGWLIVVNRDENENELRQRILKYGDSCKIINPTDFKDKFINTIDETLKLYENQI